MRGSPGVSVLAAALASVWPGGGTLVEADPAGGVMAMRHGLGIEPGLMSAAARTHDLAAGGLADHLQEWGSAQVLVGPQSGEQTAAALAAGGPSLAAALASLDGGVVVDLGRLAVGGSPGALVGVCDRVLVVCRPRPDDAWTLAGRTPALRRAASGVALVTVGDEPYRPGELAFEVGLPLAGTVPVDPAAAAMLAGETPVRPNRLRRSALWQAAMDLAGSLASEPAVDGVVAR